MREPRATPYRRILLGGAAVCTAAALIGAYRFGSSLYLYTDLKDKPGAFQGSMTVASGFLLVIAAVFTWRCGEVLAARADRAANSFRSFAGLLLFLAYDELAMFHEWATQKLEAAGVPRLFGIDQDLYVFAVYGVVALLAGVRMLPVAWRHRAAARLLVWMVVFAIGSELADFVPWHSLSTTAQTWLGPIEEGLKTMATLAATLYGHALLNAVEREAAAAPG